MHTCTQSHKQQRPQCKRFGLNLFLFCFLFSFGSVISAKQHRQCRKPATSLALPWNWCSCSGNAPVNHHSTLRFNLFDQAISLSPNSWTKRQVRKLAQLQHPVPQWDVLCLCASPLKQLLMNVRSKLMQCLKLKRTFVEHGSRQESATSSSLGSRMTFQHMTTVRFACSRFQNWFCKIIR